MSIICKINICIMKFILAAATLLFAAGMSGSVLAAEVPTAPQNGIHLVIIRVAEQDLQDEGGDRYGTIADMNSDPDHNIRCHGTVEIRLSSGQSV